jgi:hypothetical protein
VVRSDVGIGANVGVPEAGFVSKPLDGRQRMRDGVMLRIPVSRIGPSQNDLAASGTPSAAGRLVFLNGWRSRGRLRTLLGG